MIGELSGTITNKGAGYVILSVEGVGYKVYVTAETYQTLADGNEATLQTHLAVREDSLTLFGFQEHEELRFFELLIGVSGIGPKSALAILSLTDTRTLAAAILRGESAHLTKVSGIGRKNAEKIVLELRDKLGSFEDAAASGTLAADSEALEALEALGYGVRQAREALKDVPSEIETTGERIKEALKRLGRQ